MTFGVRLKKGKRNQTTREGRDSAGRTGPEEKREIRETERWSGKLGTG